jgi:hypothetical protein
MTQRPWPMEARVAIRQPQSFVPLQACFASSWVVQEPRILPKTPAGATQEVEETQVYHPQHTIVTEVVAEGTAASSPTR